MPFNGGAPFQGAPRQMPFGQVGFSGPPSPGNMSAVGSVANGAMDPESLQQGGHPRADSPSSDSVEGLDCRKQCTFDEQMQRQQDGRQPGAGSHSCLYFSGQASLYTGKQGQEGDSCKPHGFSVRVCMTLLSRRRSQVLLKSASVVKCMLHVHRLYSVLQALLSTIQGHLYLSALPRLLCLGCQPSHQCNSHCR